MERPHLLVIHNVPSPRPHPPAHRPPRAAAVASPERGPSRHLIRPGPPENEPTIVAAERNPVYRRYPTSDGTAHYIWSDLANLPRVDIPWWSFLLRDLDAMLAW